MTRYPLQETCLGVIVGTPILAAVFVGLRIHSRRKLGVQLGWDDWAIIAATLLSIAVIGPSWRFVKMWNFGMHIWQVDRRKMEPDYDEFYGVLMSLHLINIPILPLAKISMILLLLRIGSVISWLRKVLYGILAFTVGSAVVPWVIMIFICPPMTGNTWKPRTFGNLHCMGRLAMGRMLIFVTCANLFTDLLILPIPFVIVRRWLSASWRSKLVVVSVFLCGLVVTAISAAKIYLSYRDRIFAQNKIDWTYDINFCINHIENNVAIIMANIPILRGMVTQWIYRLRGKERSTSRPGYNTSDRESRLKWPFRRTLNSAGYTRKSSNDSRLDRPRPDNSSDQKILPEQEEFDFELITPKTHHTRPLSPVSIADRAPPA
ncbi:hypothetical protein M011DRAFT_476083 [Sporormia fimetaria CBS 119925]|uniref:Rhodopsin domain-containing protein n=1 Tax=Sporormia fimetaria CBS 119925 TaxID=1340428 RepID=A0A6A6VFV3_9PLEO|nr:hypothetical protein M011DRAFT_476083 [Sporormia fimetaria CBS 119925]